MALVLFLQRPGVSFIRRERLGAVQRVRPALPICGSFRIGGAGVFPYPRSPDLSPLGCEVVRGVGRV